MACPRPKPGSGMHDGWIAGMARRVLPRDGTRSHPCSRVGRHVGGINVIPGGPGGRMGHAVKGPLPGLWHSEIHRGSRFAPDSIHHAIPPHPLASPVSHGSSGACRHERCKTPSRDTTRRYSSEGHLAHTRYSKSTQSLSQGNTGKSAMWPGRKLTRRRGLHLRLRRPPIRQNPTAPFLDLCILWSLTGG